MVDSCVHNTQQPRLEVLHKIAEIPDVEIIDLLVERKKTNK